MTRNKVLIACTVLAALLVVPMMMGAAESPEHLLHQLSELIEQSESEQAMQLIRELREEHVDGDEHAEEVLDELSELIENGEREEAMELIEAIREGEYDDELEFFEVLEAYLGFGQTYSEFCSNQTAVGVLAVMSIKEIYDEQPDQAEQVLMELLEEVKSGPVRNAIRLSLKDVYEETKQPDKAVGQAVALVRENNNNSHKH